jgi:hypothetical protein
LGNKIFENIPNDYSFSFFSFKKKNEELTLKVKVGPLFSPILLDFVFPS